MTATQCLTKSDEKTARKECRTIRELLAGSERKALAPMRRARSGLTWRPATHAGASTTASQPCPHICLFCATLWPVAKAEVRGRTRVPGPIAATRRPVTTGHTERA